MRLNFILILSLLCLAAMGFAQNTSKVHCRFENIHQLNSLDTYINGINDRGSVVGGYDDNLYAHGFLRSHGDYFPVDVPWPLKGSTVPWALNDRGEIVGTYSHSGVRKGFKLTGQGYSRITVPGFSSISPLGINNKGEIVGTVDQHHGTTIVEKGFIADHGTVKLVTFPGSSSTAFSGVNKEGTIVGSYGSPDGKTFHGLLLKHGVLSTLDYPGSTWTDLFQINDDGLVLGFYWIFSSSGGPTITNNFVWKDGTFKILPYDGSFNCFESKPCPNLTFYSGMNNHNQFVGSFYPGTIPPDQYTKGFVATCDNLP